ncbi:MAG TPA: TIGR01777 family oxidoreductase [Thermoanaerobaculia bacterium]
MAKIVVAGGTGFVGEPLVRQLLGRGDDVVVLSRNPQRVRAGRGVQWDGKSAGPWASELEGAAAVVNLAGENIADGRWTDDRKRRLLASRLDATGAIVEALSSNAAGTALINASAIGFYGDRGDEELDESASRGEGFLADLVERWEMTARKAEPFARVVLLRFGIVLAPEGGALKKMLLPFRMGVGGPIGNGRQWMSWVDRADVLSMIGWVIDNKDVRGIYNATAPEPVRNRDFTRELGRALRRPAVLPVPPFALKILFGQMAEEALLAGQRVLPRRAEDDGFAFASRTLRDALASTR